MKKPAQHLIAEAPCGHAKVEITIGIDLGHVWSHYCTFNQKREVVDRVRFRTTPKAIEKWFTDLPPARIASGSGDALDLDSRATAGTGPSSHRGERA
jgi:transposase